MRAVLLSLLTTIFGTFAAAHKGAPPAPVFEPAAVVSTVPAVYPLQSVASGTVVLELSLSETGKITAVRAIHAIPSLTEPAERSVRQWKFAPARLDGTPVASKIAVAFSFVPPNVGPRV